MPIFISKLIVIALFYLKIREIARLINLAPIAVKNHLNDLEKKELIKRKKERNYNIQTYQANRENLEFIFLQQQSIISELYYSNLINQLWEEISPQVIILFGSYAKGEAIEDSDVDLFILGKEKKFSLEKYEKKLNKKIHLIFTESFSQLPTELKNNVVNGKILKGYLKIY